MEKFYKNTIYSRTWKPETYLTGYGYGLERKIKNSFGYVTVYEF